MKTKAVPIAWVRRAGARLDAGPFLGGALEARIRIEQGTFKKQPLRELTSGFKGGLFTHQFSPKRTYVEDPRYGTPMLGASSMLLADLSGLPLMSNRNVKSRSYRNLIVRHGMTLASSSGIVGRLAYARPDMDGMVSTGDTLKIQPNPALILPGYLFAFLSGKYGLPLVALGTYGSIIQHLEADHVADLPVPRVGETVETKAHNLIEMAAKNRVRASELLADAHRRFLAILGKPSDTIADRLWTSVKASALATRCDPYYFSPECLRARQLFDNATCPNAPLHEVADVFIPGMFKRLYATDPAYGYPYVTGGDVFEIAPESKRLLMRRVADAYRLRVETGTILIQEAGQLGGLIGRSVFVGSYLAGHAVSNNMVRVIAKQPSDAGYLFAALSSDPGVTLIAREGAGSSIPHLDGDRVRQVWIPWPNGTVRQRIAEIVLEAIKLRDEACNFDQEAKQLIERAIEEAV